MKKLLSILCACAVLLLTSCSPQSEKSNSEAEITAETAAETTETVTEITTKPITAPLASESTTEPTNVYEKMTYREVLEDIYYSYKFPHYEESFKDDIYDISSNEFTIYDIDNDGSDELIFLFTSCGTAGMIGVVYDHNSEGNIIVEFGGFPLLRFYDNGIVEADASHNQGPSGDFWPYTLYQYDSKTDTYNRVASVSSMGRDIVEMIKAEAEENGNEAPFEYPYEADTSNSGIVYYIRPCGFEGDVEPIDVTEYNEWHDGFCGDAELLELPFVKLTEENIQEVDQ
ncbi:MAG: hypothetical protein NC320_05245 [Clostridium sp.]|nr:hypothetical protein [Clostridium sp.]MCM1547391.1 hypothetical protein [Ruminococcus sp.]